MQRLTLCLAAAAALPFLPAPARADEPTGPKGAFTIKVQDGTFTLTFDAGKYKLTKKGQDEVLVEGAYKIDKDQIEMTDKSGPLAEKDKGPGTYKWSLRDKKLTFTKIKDEADGRAEALTAGAWTAE